MKITSQVKNILSHYDSDNPGTKNNLVRMLMHGSLAGTGNLLILPVDQGFEHGPDKSFSKNIDAYDPHYHYRLAIEAGLNAYAAPLGMLECGAGEFAGQIPTILKMNSSNSMLAKLHVPDQAITGSVEDALRLGCSAVGMTIYPGSDKSLDMIEEAKEIISEAKSKGLVAVVWAYARGGDLLKEDETSLNTISYAAHIAALIGAHIIKVKPPVGNDIKHVVRACFNGKRIVVFSGGAAKSDAEILDEVKSIKDGGGNGSIIGRNSFQRPKDEALILLKQICEIYKK
jgi:class I fructose-bisphosphate aldolase